MWEVSRMRERWITRIWAAVLSLMAVFGAMGCLVSGFHLSPIGFWTSLSWILAAVVFSLCFPRRIVLYPLAGVVLLGVFLWMKGYLSDSVQKLLQELFQVYDRAYGWGTVRWSDRDLTNVGIGTALCWMGLPIVISTCYAVVHRSDTWLAVITSLMPLACCMIVTDTVPGVVPLFVLLLVILLLMISQIVRRRDEAQGNRLLALLALPLAAGLALLFLLVPQAGYDRQAGAQRLEDTVVKLLQGDFALPDLPQPTKPEQPQTTVPPVGGGSIPKQENLKNVGPKIQSDMRILTVRAERGGVLYLRGTGYDRYTGTSWMEEAGDNITWWPEDSVLEDGGQVSISTAVTHDVLYLPYYADRDIYATMSGGKLNNAGRARQYSFRWGILPAETLLNVTAQSYSDDMQPWLQLPEQTAAWAEDRIVELFGTPNPPLTLQTVYTIADYVRQSANYDLKTARMDSNSTDFVQWFLTESDSGYCIHFASATAVLLRAAGIPSRYVTGYTVVALEGQDTPVTGKNAHAWAEFRLPDQPWCLVESTPNYETEDTPRPTLPEVTRPSVSAPEEETTVAPTLPPEPQEQPSGASAGLWGWIAAMGICVAAVLQWRIRVGIRRSHGKHGRSKQKALERWRQHALMAKLLKEPVDKNLLELAQRAKFSQHTITAEELALFAQMIQKQTARLKKKPFWMQLYYTLILALY